MSYLNTAGFLEFSVPVISCTGSIRGGWGAEGRLKQPFSHKQQCCLCLQCDID